MKDTGIVRRIDELGRIVIPKEIRKTLRIKEGDPMEIYTEKDQLVFTKYSPVEKLCEYSNGVAISLAESTGKHCFVCDRDEIVFCSNNKVKNSIGKKISSQLENILTNMEIYIASNENDNKVIRLYSDDDYNYEYQIIQPIMCDGEYFGGLILEGKYDDKKSNLDKYLCEYSAKVISKYFE